MNYTIGVDPSDGKEWAAWTTIRVVGDEVTATHTAIRPTLREVMVEARRALGASDRDPDPPPRRP